MVAVVITFFGVVAVTVKVPLTRTLSQAPDVIIASLFMLTGMLPNVADAAEAGQDAPVRQPLLLGTI